MNIEYLYTVMTGMKILTFPKDDFTYVRSAGVVWWPPFMIRIKGDPLEISIRPVLVIILNHTWVR